MTLAKFATKCPGCGEWIREGDEITFVKDDYGGGDWVCGECAEDVA